MVRSRHHSLAKQKSHAQALRNSNHPRLAAAEPRRQRPAFASPRHSARRPLDSATFFLPVRCAFDVAADVPLGLPLFFLHQQPHGWNAVVAAKAFSLPAQEGCLHVIGISARHHVVGLFGVQRLAHAALQLL